jgi:hypothetical protein
MTLPNDLKVPPNPSNPYDPFSSSSTSIETKHSSSNGHDQTPEESRTQDGPIKDKGQEGEKKSQPRKVIQMRRNLVFGAQYEFIYQEYLMSLMRQYGDDDPKWVEGWWSQQGIKKKWREDTGLRRRTLGY